jgi:hypothetical protein
MSAFKTLADLQKKVEKKSSPYSDKPKRNFLTLKDGESVRLRFLQELTEDAKGYNEARGAAEVIGAHTNPLDWKKKSGCTVEDEEKGFQCWACEQVFESKDNNGWRSRNHLLINVAYQNEDGSWTVAILDQGFGKAHVGNDVVEFAGEYGTITNRTFKFSRNGKGQETDYTLLPLDPSDEPKELAEVELHSFEGLYKKIPYEEQQTYFFSNGDPANKW